MTSCSCADQNLYCLCKPVEPPSTPPKFDNSPIAVYSMDLSTGEVQYFTSIASVQREGFDAKKVQMCIKGSRRSHKGRSWHMNY